MKTSKELEFIIKSLEDYAVSYRNAVAEEKECNDLQNDLLHSLELDNLSYHEKARTAVKIEKCRKKRRVAKESIEVLEPIQEFLDGDISKKAISGLKRTLGIVRKKEERQQNRTYVKRFKEGSYE